MQHKIPMTPDVAKVHRIKVREFEEVRFLSHSMARLEQRGITESDVIQALLAPSTRKVRADFPHKGVVWIKSRTKKLCVIFDEVDKYIAVVSAYWK